MLDITFIIPAYNASNFLDAAIESIKKAFDCNGHQIIVVDDGSSDATFEVARRQGVRCIRHPVNRGISSTLNTGIAAASSEYVAWLSADDLYTEQAGTIVARYMEQWPRADFYFGGYKLVNNSGHIHEVKEFHPALVWNGDGLIEHDLFVDLLMGCFINGATTVIRRETIVRLGLFDTSLRYTQDYGMWLLLTYAGCSAVYMNDKVGIRRVHEGQLSANPSVRKAIVQENSLTFRRLLNAEALDRIQKRLSTFSGDEALYRMTLVKRLLHLHLYHQARHVYSVNQRSASGLWTIAWDALKYFGRKAKLLPGKRS